MLFDNIRDGETIVVFADTKMRFKGKIVSLDGKWMLLDDCKVGNMWLNMNHIINIQIDDEDRNYDRSNITR